MGTRPPILVDTNIIIEAVRVGAWERLRAHEDLVTVGQCVQEALSGVPGSSGRVPIAPAHLEAPLTVVDVSQGDRVEAALRHTDLATVDEGERDLLTHALLLKRNHDHGAGGDAAMKAAMRKALLPVTETESAFLIVCADQAAVRVAGLMNLGDHLVSLEEVLERAGIKPNGKLKEHYTKRQLEEWKTKHRLGM